MATSMLHDPDEPWVPVGTIKLSPAVISYMREFMSAVGGGWIANIGWHTSVSMKESRDAPPIEYGPGLSLGAHRRQEVPPNFVDHAGDLEFILHIPREVWEASKQRLIDIDESLLFKLRLL